MVAGTVEVAVDDGPDYAAKPFIPFEDRNRPIGEVESLSATRDVSRNIVIERNAEISGFKAKVGLFVMNAC